MEKLNKKNLLISLEREGEIVKKILIAKKNWSKDPESQEVFKLQDELKNFRNDVISQYNKFKKSVSYSIGHRDYYEEVYKIGSSYIDDMGTMTKKRGIRLIKEIPEITDEMRADMYRDMLYY